jgi:hypothetical protein
VKWRGDRTSEVTFHHVASTPREVTRPTVTSAALSVKVNEHASALSTRAI